MDTKRLVIGIALAMAIVLLWQAFMGYEGRRHPEWLTKDNPPAAPQPAQPATAADTDKHASVETSSDSVSQMRDLQSVGGESGEVTLGSIQFDPDAKGKFAMGLMVGAHGAGVDLAVLNRFRLVVGQDKPYYFEQPYVGQPFVTGAPMAMALATQWVSIDDPVPCDVWSIVGRLVHGKYRLVGPYKCKVWNVDWKLLPKDRSDAVAVYSVDLRDADTQKLLLTIEKRYEVKKAPDQQGKKSTWAEILALFGAKTASEEQIEKTGQGYEFDVIYNLINHTGRPLKVKLAFDGPNTPAIENNRDIAEIFTGYDDQHTVWAGDPKAIQGFKDNKEVDLKDPKKRPLLWTAMRSSYFDAVVRTCDASGAPGPYAKIYAQSQTKDPDKVQAKDVAIGYETDELDVSPTGPGLTLPLHVYFGPTARAVLDSNYYSAFPLCYDLTLVVSSGMCGFCTFAWLVNILVWLLNAFHLVMGHDWGLAIIALVVLVRLVLHPITKRSQVSMTRMSKMAPEMERLKKKFGDDKEGLNKAMMGFYREQGITPILGCLPMFLQMPIWIALWNALQSTFEIRHARFLWGLTWIKDLSQADRRVTFHTPLSLGFFTLDAINLLPILMAVVFFIQQKLQPKPDIKTLSKEQAQQQKMMQWMSLLFPIFLYNSPSGLNLYILTSTTIGIFEAKRIRDHIKEREEAEKAGKLPPKSRGGLSGYLGGLFAKMQAQAEAIREGDRGGKKKAGN